MSDIACFMVEEIPDRYARFLRRYVSSNKAACSGPMGYHNACFRIEDGTSFDEQGYIPHEAPDENHPNWPTKCEGCDYEFTAEDAFQIHRQGLFHNVVTDEEYVKDDLPVGAMYYSNNEYYTSQWVGPDGKTLIVMIPGGQRAWEWCPDREASNCTRPGDRTHKCWVRHGTPPNITVDKNGDTCNAGAGSIMNNHCNYHGFLQNGHLTHCP